MLPDLRKFIVPCGKPDTIANNFSDQEGKKRCGHRANVAQRERLWESGRLS